MGSEVLANEEPVFEGDSAEMAQFEALFGVAEDEESMTDAIAIAAAQTTIMQKPLEVKPISPAMLLVRKVWDRMLIAYLWLQAKYLAVYRYFKRGAPQQSMQ